MKNQRKENEKFSLAQFLRRKFLLLGALVCEVIALLMDKGIIAGSDELTTRLTVAGMIIVLIYLVIDGLKNKYKYYSKKWGMGPYCNVTRSVSKMTEIERRGGKRWDKPKKAEKSRDCGGGKF